MMNISLRIFFLSTVLLYKLNFSETLAQENVAKETVVSAPGSAPKNISSVHNAHQTDVEQTNLKCLTLEKKFANAVDEQNTTTAMYNLAVCLSLKNETEKATRILEYLYFSNCFDLNLNAADGKQSINQSDGFGIVESSKEITKKKVGELLISLYWTRDNVNFLAEKKYPLEVRYSQETLIAFVKMTHILKEYYLFVTSNTITLRFVSPNKNTKIIDLFLRGEPFDSTIRFPNDLQQLSLYGVVPIDTTGFPVNLNEIIPPNLVNLDILNSRYTTAGIPCSLPIKKLIYIIDIHLDGCSIILSDSKISPENLDISPLSFINIERKINKSLVVNDYMDFSRTQDLSLNSYGDNGNVLIDLSKDISIQKFSLQMKVLNWKDARWTVNKFTLWEPLLVKTQMNVTEMTVFGTSLDVSCLPTMIEKLSIFRATRMQCTEKINLANLRFIQLTDIGSREINILSSCLSKFETTQLKELHLKRINELDMNALPNYVEKIKIFDSWKLRLVGKVVNVDFLTLKEFYLYDISKTLAHFKPVNVVVFVAPGRSLQDLLDVIIKLLENPIASLKIGPFNWEEMNFEKSIIYNIVDKQSKYYSFTNGTGKAMEESEFKSLIGYIRL